MTLNFAVAPISQTLKLPLQQKINQKTKPLGSLGRLESLALQVGLIQKTLSPVLSNASIIIFAADHGIVEEGVSAYPACVTTQMIANFLTGGAAISVFAKQHNLNLWIVDAGVNADLEPHPNLIHAKIAKGTKNFLHVPAMTPTECVQALEKGAEIVLQNYKNGCNCIGFGEMGIGNTSAAALLMHCLTQIPLAQCVGRGTGLNDEQLEHKFKVLQQALTRHSTHDAPLSILATFGGFEIAMMVGAYLKAAELEMLIMVDGFIACSALLVAYKLQPNVLEYCIFSHVSNEQGHRALLDYFNAEPLLDLQLRLGEGSAIALAYPLLQSAVTFLNDMATFADAGVSDK